MRIRRMTEKYEGRAEGLCAGLPYDTELAGSDGVSIIFWCGDSFNEEALQKALHHARNARDVVQAVASLGQPSSFWAHQDIEP